FPAIPVPGNIEPVAVSAGWRIIAIDKRRVFREAKSYIHIHGYAVAIELPVSRYGHKRPARLTTALIGHSLLPKLGCHFFIVFFQEKILRYIRQFIYPVKLPVTV